MRYIILQELLPFNSNYHPINLDQFYIANKAKIPSTKNPNYIDKLIKNLPEYSIGGYGEDRKNIWSGTYLDKTKGYMHLGVDINVPFGTEVYCPINAIVIDVFTDTDTKIGWGGRVILQSEPTAPYVILAHLDPSSICVKSGQELKCNELVGHVGTWPTNGNTFEHLHLQLRLSNDFDTMDGYGTEADLINNPCPFTTQV